MFTTDATEGSETKADSPMQLRLDLERIFYSHSLLIHNRPAVGINTFKG